MQDFGHSDDPAVQAQLDRLASLTVPQGRLGLETIRALLSRLGNPHRNLPPVFHVAGTNGKGSVCAFLRAMLEADGKRVHVTTSPHLVRYNERIRIAGKLISDDALAELLREVLDAGSDLKPSFFEVTIAAAFLAFSRTPADACVVEVGLGGRFDATNALEPDAAAICGIAALGIDHERFLLAQEEGVPVLPIARIAFEKAGIVKTRVPLAVLSAQYPPEAIAEIHSKAAQMSAAITQVTQADCDALSVSHCGLDGKHQLQNAALAMAMLNAQDKIAISADAMRAGMQSAKWPARLQLLGSGPLTSTPFSKTREIWLDGGHNSSAGQALAAHFNGQEVHLIIGMLEAKDPAAIIRPLAGSIRSTTAVSIDGHDCHPTSAFGPDALAAETLEEALLSIPDDNHPVLIAGSLYLAGEVLKLNEELPD